MVFDLLDVSPLGVYAYEIETNAGTQKKQAVLGESDPLFVELRHEHIAFVLNALAEKAKAFSDAGGGRLDADASTGSLKRAVESLPRFMEAQAKLSVHTSIAARLNAMLKKHGLGDVGRVEERVIFGEATSKDVVALFNEFAAAGAAAGAASARRWGRALAAGASWTRPCSRTRTETRPGKDATCVRRTSCGFSCCTRRRTLRSSTTPRRWSKASGESRGRRDGVVAERLGVKVSKPRPGLGARPQRRVQDHQGEAADGSRRQGEWDLSQPQQCCVCATDRRTLLPDGPRAGGDAAGRVRCSAVRSRGALGRRRAENPGQARAQRARGDMGDEASQTERGWLVDGGDAEFSLGGSAGSLAGLGLDDASHARPREQHRHKRSGSVIPPRRLIVFVVGGVTRGEMREAHALSRELGREVLIGGTEVLTPETFMGELARLGGGFSGAIARTRGGGPGRRRHRRRSGRAAVCVCLFIRMNRIVAHACSFSRIPRIRTCVKARADCGARAGSRSPRVSRRVNGVFSPFFSFFRALPLLSRRGATFPCRGRWSAAA